VVVSEAPEESAVDAESSPRTRPIYQSETVAIAALFLVPPVGVALMWLFQKWSVVVKAAVSVVAVSGLVVVLAALGGRGQPRAAASARSASGLERVGPIAAAAKPSVPAAVSQSLAGIASLATAVANPPTSAGAAAPTPASVVTSGATLPTTGGASAAAVPAAGAPLRPAPAEAPLKLSASQKAEIRTLLDGNVTRLEQIMAAGGNALGTTRYADSDAATQAMDDPKSSAARFKDWRDNAQLDDDTPVNDALEKVNDLVPEPTDAFSAAFEVWISDMDDFKNAISEWADTASDWQTRDKADAELTEAKKAASDHDATVRKDVADILSKG
jgi:hypothetical protein